MDDLRTNKHFTLKTKRITRADVDEFVACCRPGDRHNREATWSEVKPEGRWRSFSYGEILARDKVSLNLFWLRDESLEDSSNLPEPHLLAQEIADDLRSALASAEAVATAIERQFTGHPQPRAADIAELQAVHSRYHAHWQATYAGQRRLCSQPFWARRLGAAGV